MCRDIITYVGDEGLFKLWKEAMLLFRSVVLDLNLDYDRFREDFVNSHRYTGQCDPITSVNHMVNIGRIDSLLGTRKDLMYKFSALTLDLENFALCINEFMFVQSLRQNIQINNFECYLSEETISVIVEAANDIPLFRRKIDEKDMDMLFNQCISPEIPLIANNNSVLAYFFSNLNYRSVISRMYMLVISSNKLIVSSSGKKFLNQSDLSTALHTIENNDAPVKKRIERWCVYIKNSIIG